MAGVRTVKVRFDSDTTGFQRGTREAGRALDGWRGKASRFGATAKLAFAAAGLALFAFAKQSVGAFVEAQDAQLRLQDAFARFPKLADTNIERLRELNTELMNKTRFDDDAFASGQAVLAQFKLSGKQIESVTPLLADYAAKTGRDLPTAAGVLGKAFLGQTRALKELGINYTKATDNVDKLRAAAKKKGVAVSKEALATAQARDMELDRTRILGLLRKQVGGFAEKEGKTAAGQAAILSNKFGEIKESVGQKLLPALMALAGWGLRTIDWIEKNQETVKKIVIGLGAFAAVVLTVMAAIKIYNGVLIAIRAATLVWTAAQWLLNTALFANPIGLIILAVAALIAIIVLVATKTKFFQTVWRASWTFVKNLVFGIGRWFRDVFWGKWLKPTWDKIISSPQRFIDFLKGLPGKLRSALASVETIIPGPFKAAFNAISRFWNSTVGRLSFSVPSWVPGIGGKGFSMPNLPTFHRGGVVPGPFGREVPILARAGEVVQTAAQAASGPDILEAHIHIGDEVVRVVRVELKKVDRAKHRLAVAGMGNR
jgi:hypothetical protein